MKKTLISCLYFFILFLPLAAQEAPKQVEEKPIIVPDPLELKKGWWEYFDVGKEQLPERIETFKKHLSNLESSLDAEEHKEIIELNQRIISGLESLKKKKSRISTLEPPRLQLLKEYSVSQLFEIHENLFQNQNENDRQNKNLESLKVFQNRTHSLLDKHILQYQDLPISSYENLLMGLKIINTRVKLAIQNSEIQSIEKRLEYLGVVKKLLEDELKNAKRKLTFEGTTLQELTQEWEASKHLLKEANSKLSEIEQEGAQLNEEELPSELLCCLWDYKILTQKIRIEKLHISALLNHIKIILFEISSDHHDVDSEAVQTLLAEWSKVLAESKENLKEWQRQLDDNQAKVSRLVAQSLKEEQQDIFSKENIVADVHLELAKTFALLEELQINISKTELLNKMVESQFVQKKSLAETWTVTAKYSFNQAIDYFGEKTSFTVFRVKDQPVTTGVLLKTFLIVLAAILFSKYMRKFLIKRKLVEQTFSKSTEYIVLRLIHYGIILAGLLFALGFLGLDFTNLAIVAGALGVGIGFGLQSMVSNILSGFTLLLKRFLKVGDIVELENALFGRVISINLQETQIETFDGANVIIPNSQLTSQQLTNWTMYNTCRRFKVPFGVAYGSDKDQINEAITEAVIKLPYVVSEQHRYPNPVVWFKEFGASSVNFELIAWVDLTIPVPHGTASSSIMWEIDNILKQFNVSIPFPQQDIYIKELPKDFTRQQT